MTNPTPEDILANLKANPHPKQTHLEMVGRFAHITINGHKIAYDGDQWWACGEQITPQFGMNGIHQEIDRVFRLAQKIKDHVLDKTTTPTWEQIKDDCVGPDLPTEQTFVSIDRYRELEAELKTMTTSRDATQERVEALQQLLPLFCLGVNAPTDKAREKIESLYSRVKELGLLANDLTDKLKTVTEERDDLSVRVKHKTDVIVAQAAQIQQHSDGWEQTEAQLEAMTTERDDTRKNYLDLVNNNPLSPTINTIAEKLGVCPAEPGPMFEAIDRLKSKADRAGLLSVVCRRLCGDENASIETVHAAIDRCHEEFSTIEFIKERLGIDPDGPVVVSLGEVRSLVVQTIKSLGEKTVEVAKLQEGLTNYKAHVEGLTKRVEQMTFERDAERVGNKWLSETIEDLKRTTVKLPGEHTLRRLFNRHNTPDKYDDGTTIPTIERFLLIIENLCRNSDCAERRFEEMNAISTRVNTESEDAHATLDEMGIPRWTTVGNHNERYLSLSARIRSVFQTHTKV